MDMDMGMFPRTRLGRMHDPFAGLGADFGFPHFGSMRSRQRPTQDDDDFFTRLPAEFRQYIPESFGHRRTGPNSMPSQTQQPPQSGPFYQNYVPTGSTPPTSAGIPQSPSKKLCDAAIQTEERSEVDNAAPIQGDHLNQHGLRNTVDMGVKSATENEAHGPRSHSAPPNEQLQQQQQQIPVNGQQRPTPPPQGGWSQYGNQAASQHAGYAGQQHQQPQYQKAYYPPQQQSHPQQKQQTPPPPQTPGGSYVRSIPIFVEGRSEPIINAHKDIPQQSASNAPSFAAQPQQQPQQQSQQQQPYPQSNVHQQHRPTPLNTQQQPAQEQVGGVPPQTPHTLNSINKIQDIQRDVLDLMSKVEKFTGTRKDKEYVYLDEMLTRNLLKLDTIDTNGKDSIRLARKEAIKCIQASINVLEAKAEENAKNASSNTDSDSGVTTKSQSGSASSIGGGESSQQHKSSFETKDQNFSEKSNETIPQSGEAGKQQEAIPLPPPDSDANAREKSPAESTKVAGAAAAGNEAKVGEGSTSVAESTSIESK